MTDSQKSHISPDNKKPLASISLDLDNQWSYMKIHGDEGWEKYPSYFDIFIPHVLDILDELNLKITFFIVGKDAENDANRKYLKMITQRGHEVGNHSYHRIHRLANDLGQGSSLRVGDAPEQGPDE